MLKNARRLISQEDSAMIQRPDVPRSTFRGAWTRKTTFNAGLLVPFLVDEILPGDMMKYRVSAFIRMQTPLYPIMDNQRIDTHFFFVPNRLVWSNWQRFMGEQSTPEQSIDLQIPKMSYGGYDSFIETRGEGRRGIGHVLRVASAGVRDAPDERGVLP